MNRKKWFRMIICFSAMALLITVDVREYVGQALQLCLYTVVPSLFPFLFISIWTNGVISGTVPFLAPFMKFCGVPSETASVWLLGILGGYPVGAQLTGQLYGANRITLIQGCHLLSFCSNPGPAFIFGITGTVFNAPWIPWILWILMVLSSLVTGALLPKTSTPVQRLGSSQNISVTSAMASAVSTMAKICGWIILFRIIIGLCADHVFQGLPPAVHVFISGLLELSNGTLMLTQIQAPDMRFMVCAIILSFGGLCVLMQTSSGIGRIPLKFYILGKCLQTLIVLVLSIPLTYLVFPKKSFSLLEPVIAVTGLLAIIVLRRKITVAFSGQMLYNTEKQTKEGRYALS